jgi:hypothetical protein
MDADLTSFLKGPTPCVGVSVDHYARLLNECRCKTIAATLSFRMRFKIMVANWTPPAPEQECVGRQPLPRRLELGVRPFLIALRSQVGHRATSEKRQTTEVADSFDYLVDLQERRRRAGKQFYASRASPIA